MVLLSPSECHSCHSCQSFTRQELVGSLRESGSFVGVSWYSRGASVTSAAMADPAPLRDPSLFEACENGDAATVALLLDGGASHADKDCNGRTALMLACLGGHTETAELLSDPARAPTVFPRFFSSLLDGTGRRRYALNRL